MNVSEAIADTIFNLLMFSIAIAQQGGPGAWVCLVNSGAGAVPWIHCGFLVLCTFLSGGIFIMLGFGIRGAFFGTRDPSLRKKAYFKIAFSQTVDGGDGWAGGQPPGHPGTTSG